MRFLDWRRHFGGKAKAVCVFLCASFFSDDVQTVICTTYFSLLLPLHISPPLSFLQHTCEQEKEKELLRPYHQDCQSPMQYSYKSILSQNTKYRLECLQNLPTDIFELLWRIPHPHCVFPKNHHGLDYRWRRRRNGG